LNSFIHNTLVIAHLQALRSSRPLFLTLFSSVALPIPMLFFARYLASNSTQLGPRLVAGSIVFSVGINIVGSLGQQLSQDRFSYRLKLIRACPIHPASYVSGILLTGTGRALLNACLILAFAPALGLDFHFSLWFFPIVALTAVSLAGIGLIIATWSPNWEVASTLSGVSGTFVVLMSPIYFPVSRLPEWLQPIAQLSPYTHAGDALTAVLSDGGDVISDVIILACITMVGLSITILGIRWREL
jgi:ABC-2 type transport system permease protein